VAAIYNSFEIDHNTLSQATWGIGAGQNTGANIATNLFVHDNDINLGTSWFDSSACGGSCPFHRDGVIIYGQSSGNSWNGVYFYNNYLHGDWWADSATNNAPTAQVYINQNIQSVWYFNNVNQIDGHYMANGLLVWCCGNIGDFVVNNTFVGYSSTAGGNAIYDVQSGSSQTLVENNIVNWPREVTPISRQLTTTFILALRPQASPVSGQMLRIA
jgi:hypothetical protein